EVVLWARDPAPILRDRRSPRLPQAAIPAAVAVTGDLDRACDAPTLLLAVPMQELAGFLAAERGRLDGRTLVACCKGIDLGTGLGPAALIRRHCPDAEPALISGPGFAADLAMGLPTALTLAVAEPQGAPLQSLLSGETLRLYRSTDLIG